MAPRADRPGGLSMAQRRSVRLDRGSGGRGVGGRAPAMQPSTIAVAPKSSAAGQGCGVVLVILLALFAIGKCSSDAPDAAPDTAQASMSEPAVVSARSLNCRREPEAAAAIAEGLSRADQVIVAERRGDWARLTRVGGDCWVSGAFLTAGTSAPDAGAGGAPSSAAQGLMSTDAGSAVAAAGTGYVAAKAAKTSRKRGPSRRRSASRGRRGSSGGGYSAGGCPCSGSQICIGPRGGRYCITSGGNKRYGV